jgi:hypothetical protein
MAILTIGKGGAECRKSARLGPRGEVSGISRAALPSIGGGARCRASAGVFSQCNDLLHRTSTVLKQSCDGKESAEDEDSNLLSALSQASPVVAYLGLVRHQCPGRSFRQSRRSSKGEQIFQTGCQTAPIWIEPRKVEK